MTQTRRRGNSWWRRTARALGDEVEPRGVARLVHHGARVLLLLATSVAIFLLFPAPRLPDAAVLERGVVASHDVIAEFDFDIPKDPEALLREQVEAASAVSPVYDHAPTVRDSVRLGVRAFFASADSIATLAPVERRGELLQQLMQRNRISPTPGSVAVLADPRQRGAIEAALVGMVQELYPQGIAPSSVGPGGSAIKVRLPGGEERVVPHDSLLTRDRLFSLAALRVQAAGGEAAELARLLLIRFFQPNLIYNASLTELARQRARDVVSPVKATVLRGERIIGAHERVGEEEEARLQAYQAELTRRGLSAGESQRTLGRALGAILFNTLVLSLLGLLLLFFRRSLYHDWRSVLLLTGLVLSVTAAAAVIARLELPQELLPVTFASLIVAVLWDGRLGLSLALILALLLGGQTPFLGVTTPFTAAMGGAAAAFSVRIVQRRSKTWLFISIISLAYIAAAVTMGLLRDRGLAEVVLSMGWGITNAVVVSLLAIGFLPLLEMFTGITTDQTLLELSDLNRKLLKRLSLEAPGTYAHTVNVANLAEAACHAIGANGLLARVGAYYHDIGKLTKPQYFIENQPRGRNPHDKLKPATSSSIIRSHVLEGLKLADAERLPEAVKRFIPEHHGTQQVAFFLNRAREQDPDGPMNPGDFAYPGPKPQIKETAILMLADSVESAARALQDPTPTRIRELVDRLVSQKIAAGQLDQSPLTLREIDLVKETLAKVLTGMYHHRIDYPTPPPVGAAEEPAEVEFPTGSKP